MNIVYKPIYLKRKWMGDMKNGFCGGCGRPFPSIENFVCSCTDRNLYPKYYDEDIEELEKIIKEQETKHKK